jgi:hypothetical protein
VKTGMTPPYRTKARPPRGDGGRICVGAGDHWRGNRMVAFPTDPL